MGARQYVPILGRFFDVEPEASGNTDAYNCRNDPIDTSDGSIPGEAAVLLARLRGVGC